MNIFANHGCMTRNELYQQILSQLTGYLREKGLLTETENEEVQGDLGIDHFADACEKLSGIGAVRPYKKMITWISDGIDDNDEIQKSSLSVKHLTTTNTEGKKLKEFCYIDKTLVAAMPAKCIVKVMNSEISGYLEGNCREVLELICYSYRNQNKELDYLWDCFQGQHSKDYFLLTKGRTNAKTKWRLFAYAYFCFVNTARLQMPEKLKFDANKEFAPEIEYKRDNRYEQYFDVYDVMSESKYATDVLTRYLRLYQILEYLGYRNLLADMTKGNIKENGFVRNVVGKASKSSNDEFKELKKGLKDPFPLATIIADGDITAKQKKFIGEKLMIDMNKPNMDDKEREKKLWDIVYHLRNCIVHNKESELHFTFANTDVYADGISLMKLLIRKLEPALVEVINSPEKKHFEFNMPNVPLY